MNHVVLHQKELIYCYSLSGMYRTHLNPSRVLFILLLCHVSENKEAQECCPMSCLRYVWDADSVAPVLHDQSTTRREMVQLPLQWELLAYTTLLQGGTLLKNNNQLQLSSIKGAILVSDVNLVSNRATEWRIKYPDTVTFRTTASPGVLSRIMPLLSTMLLISAPLFLLKGRTSKL